jgi:hypothetical protein
MPPGGHGSILITPRCPFQAAPFPHQQTRTAPAPLERRAPATDRIPRTSAPRRWRRDRDPALVLRCSASRQHVGALDVRHWACHIGRDQWGPRWATRDVKGFRMKTRVANPTEQRCPACDGTGVLAAIQPVQPDRRIYPPPCGEYGGKGRIPKTDN